LEKEVGPLADLKVELVDSERYEEWKRNGYGAADLVIGSHSLSELDWNTFKEYFDNVVSKAPVFFYATQRTRPSPELVNRKLELIRQRFSEERHFATENGQVANVLFVQK
jgi:hypothetical protein